MWETAIIFSFLTAAVGPTAPRSRSPGKATPGPRPRRAPGVTESLLRPPRGTPAAAVAGTEGPRPLLPRDTLAVVEAEDMASRRLRLPRVTPAAAAAAATEALPEAAATLLATESDLVHVLPARFGKQLYVQYSHMHLLALEGFGRGRRK